METWDISEVIRTYCLELQTHSVTWAYIHTHTLGDTYRLIFIFILCMLMAMCM